MQRWIRATPGFVSAQLLMVACGGNLGQHDNSSDAGGGHAGHGGAAGASGAPGGTGNTGGSAQSSEPWWPHIDAHGCQSAGVPSHRDAPAAGESLPSLPPIYLALSKLRLSAGNDAALMPSSSAWRGIGFDLDSKCTQSSTCAGVSGEPIRDQSCQPKGGPSMDGDQCRDNMVGRLMPMLASSASLGHLFGVTEADWNCELHRGGFSVIFKIGDYNGEPNDPSVRVDLYTSPGLSQPPPWLCRADANKPDVRGTLTPDWNALPTWPASLRWRIARSSLSDPGATPSSGDLPSARAGDPHAYVRNGYLFASFSGSTEFWLNGVTTAVPGFRFEFYRTILAGRIARDTSWTLRDATLAGVIDPERLLAGFREIGICENMCQTYDNVAAYVREYVDVTLRPDGSAADPCNGLSWGASVEAREARTSSADIVDVPPPADCPEPRHPHAPRHGSFCTP